jgi:hypothetical protein
MPSSPKELLITQDDEQLLGALRIVARQYRGGSVKSGEELVELTLRTAIQEYASRPADVSLFRWLRSVMQRHLH